MKEPQYDIPPEVVPVGGLNPWYPFVSSARQVMFTGQLAQANVLDGRTRKRQQSGLEREIAKATVKHQFDRDVVILACIPRFNSLVYGESFAINPMDVVIFEDYETRQMDMIELPRFHVMHQHYGFRYDFDEEVYNKLTKGTRFPKGTVIAKSPNVTEDGDYMYGLETNVCRLSLPDVIEDGVLMSRSYAERIRATGFESRIITFGRSHYPINAYGNAEVYKPFPDVGEKINTNGLICALRPYDVQFDAVYMSRKKLLKPVYGLDIPTYGVPDATVVDIRVLHNDRIPNPRTPVQMTEQLRKYHDADKRFYAEVIRTCLQRNGRILSESTNLSHRLWNLLYQAIGFCGEYLVEEGLWSANDAQILRAQKQYRGERLDEYRVEITFEYKTAMGEGPKVSDISGGKGVTSAVVPDEDMPVDRFGNRAEVAVLSSSVNRMNTGRDHEQLVGAAGRDVIKRIRRSYALPDMGVLDREEVEQVVYLPSNKKLGAKNFEYLMGFYKLLNTVNFDKLDKPETVSSGRHLRHLVEIILDGNEAYGLYIQIRSGRTRQLALAIQELSNPESPYFPELSPVTYRDLNGKMQETLEPVLIGPNYYLGLEKTATDGSGVSSSKTNHFGIPARLTNADKYTSPGRQTVTRTTGESEGRNHAAAYGGEPLSDNMDMNNNPVVHKEVCRTLLTHPTPTDIERMVDREKFPLGGHRPLAFLRHLMVCSGKDISVD